jgi:thymidylate synthase (FAD)
MEKINVLDKGYIRLVDVMGGDLTTVNAARVSYDKESKEMSEADVKLVKFLAREDHNSPFRHSTIQFEVFAPLMVARQWWKYIVGSDHRDPFTAWNESSRRYVTEEVEFYLVDADAWRSAPENKKQGSGEPLPIEIGMEWTEELAKLQQHGQHLYEEAMNAGICAEQARLFLPAYGLYVRWYWTSSLFGVAHFLNQRLKHDAQKEIQDYAKATEQLMLEHFPHSLKELVK